MVRWILTLVIVGSLQAQQFTKITAGSLVHDGGASRSVNWMDYDNDGYLDLFVSNSSGNKGVNDFLYHNKGFDGSYAFTKIISSVSTDFGRSDGASFGDYDNDGDMDLFVVNWYDENNMFYENSGAPFYKFSAVTTGIAPNDGGLSETCAWGDYDNDGWLDLYVANSGNAGVARVNFLYKNNGNKTFTKITIGLPVTDIEFSRGATWVDYDRDGDQDLFVVNEVGQENSLYRNMLIESGSATFTKITGDVLVTDAQSSLSASWGDLDNDGDLDVIVANGFPSGESEAVYLQNSDHSFTRTSAGDLGTSGGFSMGSALADLDNDGDLDVYVTNSYAGVPSVDFMFKNMLVENGSLSFQKVTTGSPVTDAGDGYGVSWGDYDRDGDVDLFVAKTAGEDQDNAFYRNDNANGNHWVQFRCTGVTANRSALGAVIKVKTTIAGQPRWQMRMIEGQSGYCGQTQYAHFGLNTSQVIDSLIVEWPLGHVDIFTAMPADSLYALTENDGYTVVGLARNAPPALTRPLRDTTLLEDFGRRSLVKLSEYFSDADHTDMTFTTTALTPGVTASITGDSLILVSTADFFGEVLIRVEASDDIAVLADTFQVTITDVVEPILLPTVTTSVFQNPASANYADIVVVSTVNLIAPPGVTITPAGGSVSNIVMTAIAGSTRMFRGSYKFASTGLHSLGTSVETYQNYDSAVTRDFNAVILKPGLAGQAATPGGASRIIVTGPALYKEVLVLASESLEDGDRVCEYTSGDLSGQQFRIEFPVTEKKFDQPQKLFIAQLDEQDQWVRRPTTYVRAQNKVLADVTSLGKFKIVYDPSAAENNALIGGFTLNQNYPNPFNPSTAISFDLTAESRIGLAIYNALGQKVRTLFEGVRSAGHHAITWDGRSDAGTVAASGIYLYRLEWEGAVQSKKMIFLK